MRLVLPVGLALLACAGCDSGRRLLVQWFDPTYEAPVAADAGTSAVAVKLQEVASGFNMPTDIQFVPGKPERMVVLEKGGSARIVDLGNGKATTVGELLRVDVRQESELGLLGLAFHPRYTENGRFYVNYNPAGGVMRTRISEWVLMPDAMGKQAARETRVLLEVEQPYQNHDAGQLAFGPDGMLYIGLGDGGWMGDPQENGQNLSTLLGSMLRVDVDAPGDSYRVPADNPFVGKKGARGEIFAYGLRNPWRFTFDPRGRLIVADVGQDAWEEIDIVEKGANLGWDIREGRHCFEPKEGCQTEGLVDPIHEYSHAEGQSITGGYVYEGKALPSLQGRYIFGDFTSGRIWALTLPERVEPSPPPTLLGQFPMLVSTFAKDAAGEVYVADFGKGTVFRLQ